MAAMSSEEHGENSADDVLGRADALLRRHRTAPSAADPHAIPTLTEPVGMRPDPAAIPTLTDLVTDAEVLATVTRAPNPDAGDRAPDDVAHGGEIISRVQSQNLEHSVYQKLKQGMDTQISDVLQNRFMPEIAGALDQALNKISGELKSNIDAMVRASIENTLQARLSDPAAGGGCRGSFRYNAGPRQHRTARRTDGTRQKLRTPRHRKPLVPRVGTARVFRAVGRRVAAPPTASSCRRRTSPARCTWGTRSSKR